MHCRIVGESKLQDKGVSDYVDPTGSLGYSCIYDVEAVEYVWEDELKNYLKFVFYYIK